MDEFQSLTTYFMESHRGLGETKAKNWENPLSVWAWVVQSAAWTTPDIAMGYHAEMMKFFHQDIIKKFVFQLEKGETANHYHFQCAFALGDKHKMRFSTLVELLVKRFPELASRSWLRPAHLDKDAGTGRALFKYCMKAGGIQGPWSDKTERKQKSLDSLVLTPWQWKLFDLFKGMKSGGERTIVWLYDPIGESGKQHLGRALVNCLGFLEISPGSEINMSECLKGQDDIFGVWINYPRTLPKSLDLKEQASFMEKLKDRIICGLKYKSEIITLEKSPIVFVTANFHPEHCKGAPFFSPDRLKVLTMTLEMWNEKFDLPTGGVDPDDKTLRDFQF